MKDNSAYTRFIKNTAKDLGFDFCGIAKATFLEDDAHRLESWLNKGRHGDMHYMQNNFDLRTNPTLLVPGAKSVITLLYNYYPQEKQRPDAPQIAKYAYGEDYHFVIRKKLNAFFEILKKEIGEIQGRGFVDSAPVLERTWAQKSGLGWIGKNGNLINKNKGSFFFIASLIIDVDLDYDDAYAKDYCGSCTRCIDECPTDAILPGKEIDGSKCISYFTIELKDALLPDKMKGQFNNWMFGCDVCQDVCPWNRFSEAQQQTELTPVNEILNYSFNDWAELTEENFKIIFKNSTLKRSKFAGIKRNLKFLEKEI